MDRKNWSPKREAALRRIIKDAVDSLHLRNLHVLDELPDRIAEEYRRNYVPRGARGDDQTAPLFDDAA